MAEEAAGLTVDMNSCRDAPGASKPDRAAAESLESDLSYVHMSVRDAGTARRRGLGLIFGNPMSRSVLDDQCPCLWCLVVEFVHFSTCVSGE